MGGDGQDVGRGFDGGAGQYDDVLAHNRHGARRLVAALPEGEWADVLDVGCGTGFVSEAMVARFPVRRVTGVDPSEGMLEHYARRLAELPVEATAVRAGVLDMPVPDGAFDAVVSGMAFHWFRDKPAAVAAMARRLRPGGVLGILGSGRGSDRQLQLLMEAVRPPLPAAWTGVFDAIQRGAEDLAGYMRDAGLEVLDAWEERRVRRVDPDAYMARIMAVSSHLSEGLDPAEAEAHGARVVQAVHDAAGPDGFLYDFVKIYGVARRPG
ncbi:MAG: class I SAM-dependent methyltransferase [Thermoleophilia bacterium]